MNAACSHLDSIQEVAPGAEGCEECLAAGDSWVHLRLCLTCGHVGCCDESPKRHARGHFDQTGHPVMRSFEPSEDWTWCFVDDLLIDGSSARHIDSEASMEFMRRHELFAGLPEEDLIRLHGMAKPVFIPAGQVVMREGEKGDALYVILEGALTVTTMRANQEVVLGVRRVGEIVGEMALLENAPRSATVRAEEDSLLLSVSQTAFESLLACSSSAGRAIMRTMLSRLRSQQALLRQQEKMASLGTLSAGLAHELNNPAAAIKRSASYLSTAITDWEDSAANFGNAGLDASLLTHIAEVEKEVMARTDGSLDALTRSEREDEVQDWLEDRGVSEPWELSPALVGAGWDMDALARLCRPLSSTQAEPVVRWVGSRAQTRELIGEIQKSAEAISQIVGSVKTYSYLDQAPVQEVDVRRGLEDTLVMLRHKLKEGGVHVTKEFAPEVPAIEGYGSELNQVWTNLIDNAIDAMGGQGDLVLRAYPKDDRVVVEIEDHGPGIPKEIRDRIYDAFFTTKPPGVGSGLGLHIVYNIITEKHHGQINLESEPGKTVFQIELPQRLRKARE